MKRFPFLFTLFFGFTGLLSAEEQTTKFRLIGLSAHERDNDLQITMQSVPDVKLTNFDAENSEITLNYDTVNLFPGRNPKTPLKEEEITKRLDELVGTASNHTFSLKPASTVPKDKLTKLDFHIGILDCKACRYAAYSIVASLDGVEKASVTPETSVLNAWIDATKTNREALEAALKKAHVDLVGAK